MLHAWAVTQHTVVTGHEGQNTPSVFTHIVSAWRFLTTDSVTSPATAPRTASRRSGVPDALVGRRLVPRCPDSLSTLALHEACNAGGSDSRHRVTGAHGTHSVREHG